jgi:predicted transcriptional regulator
MTAAKIARARELYEQADLTVVEIAKTLGVSRASVYRHLSAPRERHRSRPADVSVRWSVEVVVGVIVLPQ